MKAVVADAPPATSLGVRPVPAAAVIAGFVMCAMAWWNAGGENRLEEQTGAIWLGVAGLAVTVLGEAAWLRAGRRALARYRERLLDDAAALTSAVGDEPTTGDELLGMEGMQRYHRAGCPVLTSNPGEPADRARHEAAGRQPCGICRP